MSDTFVAPSTTSPTTISTHLTQSTSSSSSSAAISSSSTSAAAPSQLSNDDLLDAIKRLLSSLPNDGTWSNGLIDTDRVQRHLDRSVNEYQHFQRTLQNTQHSHVPHTGTHLSAPHQIQLHSHSRHAQSHSRSHAPTVDTTAGTSPSSSLGRQPPLSPSHLLHQHQQTEELKERLYQRFVNVLTEEIDRVSKVLSTAEHRVQKQIDKATDTWMNGNENEHSTGPGSVVEAEGESEGAEDSELTAQKIDALQHQLRRMLTDDSTLRSTSTMHTPHIQNRTRYLPDPAWLFQRQSTAASSNSQSSTGSTDDTLSIVSAASTSSIRRRGVPNELIKSAQRLLIAVDSLDTLTKIELINILAIIVYVTEFDNAIDSNLANEFLPTLETTSPVLASSADNTDSLKPQLIETMRKMLIPVVEKHIANVKREAFAKNNHELVKKAETYEKEIEESSTEMCARCNEYPIPAVILNTCKHRLCLRCLSKTPSENATCSACRSAINYTGDDVVPDAVVPSMDALTLNANRSSSASSSTSTSSTIFKPPPLPPPHSSAGRTPSIPASTNIPDESSSSDTSRSYRTSSSASMSRAGLISESPSNTSVSGSDTNSRQVSARLSSSESSATGIPPSALLSSPTHKPQVGEQEEEDEDEQSIVTLAPQASTAMQATAIIPQPSSPLAESVKEQAPSASTSAALDETEAGAQQSSRSDTVTSSSSTMAPEKDDDDEENTSHIPISEGYSCHQCKTSKKPRHLAFCTNTGVGRRKRACHKKFCDACVKWRYQEDIHAMSKAERAKWICPACADICTCAQCVRKREEAQSQSHPPSQSQSQSQFSSQRGMSGSASGAAQSSSLATPVHVATALQSNPYAQYMVAQQLMYPANYQLPQYNMNMNMPSALTASLQQAHPSRLYQIFPQQQITSQQPQQLFYNQALLQHLQQQQHTQQSTPTTSQQQLQQFTPFYSPLMFAPPPPVFGASPHAPRDTSLQSSILSQPALAQQSSALHGSPTSILSPTDTAAALQALHQQQLQSQSQSQDFPQGADTGAGVGGGTTSDSSASSILTSPQLYAMHLQQQQQQQQLLQMQLQQLQRHQQESAFLQQAALGLQQHTQTHTHATDPQMALQTLATVSQLSSTPITSPHERQHQHQHQASHQVHSQPASDVQPPQSQSLSLKSRPPTSSTAPPAAHEQKLSREVEQQRQEHLS